MCTIAIATRVFETTPLLLAANREERHDRPAIPPAQLESNPAMYGPMDLAAGGTWIGINHAGLVVALTNRPADAVGDRSRGWLVRELLRTTNTVAGIRRLRQLIQHDAYRGFNVLLADRGAAVIGNWMGELTVERLEPGVHVLVNEGQNDEIAKSAVVRACLALATDSPAVWRRRAADILTDHGLHVCRHGSTAGTRSSSIVTVQRDGHTRWWFADGPPCSVPYRVVLDGTV